MTPEEQRIAIAEACGWRWEQPFNRRKKENHLVPPSGRACIVWKDGGLGGNLPPDYLNDLNAIHEAEKVKICSTEPGLSDGLYWTYEDKLQKIVNPHGLKGVTNTHATATQRAEAFLRTIGKWKD